ncbi:hypothetical protein BA060_02545 [Brucella sp. B13-0095]|nr:hypothetical protein BA060_02545 [Brucella sp. B13-0095]
MLIDKSDATYVEWCQTLRPTPWPRDLKDEQTEAALAEVLSAHGLTLFAETLSDVKQALKKSVDTAAENERLKYITPGEGQAMTYQQKVDEARAFKAASDPKAADYPILSSEVGITAETLSEVADIVLAAFAQWQQIGAAIEAIRLGAKRDIDAAEDEATARAIVDAIVWPSAQMQP